MEYRLGTDNRIKARGETVELTCPQCGKKGHFGVFSNFERRIAVKLPLPLECQTVYFLVCPNCAAMVSIVMRRKSYRWHLERIVTGILFASVVARMKMT